MDDEKKSEMRLECLHMVTHAVGENTDPAIILEYAQDYFEWIMGYKPYLRLVPRNEDTN